MSSKHEDDCDGPSTDAGSSGEPPSPNDDAHGRPGSGAHRAGSGGLPHEYIRLAKHEWESAVDALSQIVCLLDSNGHIVRANRAVDSWGLASVSRARDLNLHDLLHPRCHDDHCRLRDLWSDAWPELSHGRSVKREYDDNTLERRIALQLRPVVDPGAAAHQRPSHVVAVIDDVTELRRAEAVLRTGHAVLEQQVSARTRDLLEANARLRQEIEERRQAEQALRQSETCYRQLVDTMMEGLVVFDLDGLIKYANDSLCRMIGYERAELVGEPAARILADMRHCTVEELCDRHGACPCGRYEARWTRRDGTPLTVLVSPQRLDGADGKILGCFAVVTDVTDRKRAEQALRHSEGELRLLSSQLLAAQEVERKRIASELHDSIGQMLSALKFQLEGSATLLASGDTRAVADLLDRLIPKIQSAVEEVRRISMDLRPSMLDDLGVVPTLAWFFREFQAVYGDVHLETALRVTEQDVPAALKTAIYRIVQEALSNVVRHAHASVVEVQLERHGTGLELTVRDDGAGFDVVRPAQRAGDRGNGLGLSTMRERAETSGGSFRLESGPGRGTQLRVTWPCRGSM